MRSPLNTPLLGCGVAVPMMHKAKTATATEEKTCKHSRHPFHIIDFNSATATPHLYINHTTTHTTSHYAISYHSTTSNTVDITTLCYTSLHYATQCYTATRGYAMLHYLSLFYTTPHYSTACCVTPHDLPLHSTMHMSTSAADTPCDLKSSHCILVCLEATRTKPAMQHSVALSPSRGAAGARLGERSARHRPDSARQSRCAYSRTVMLQSRECAAAAAQRARRGACLCWLCWLPQDLPPQTY